MINLYNYFALFRKYSTETTTIPMMSYSNWIEKMNLTYHEY